MKILKKLLLTTLILGVIWSVAFSQQDEEKKPPKPPPPIIKVPSPKPTPKPTPTPTVNELLVIVDETGD